MDLHLPIMPKTFFSGDGTPGNIGKPVFFITGSNLPGHIKKENYL
jgi:hypothetical protein